jgi:GNAT superfamily N-acetyltransferase
MALLENKETSVLEPMNLHDPAQFDALQRQRVLCGWNYSDSDLEGWRAQADKGIVCMFWVVPQSANQLPAPARYAGHIMGNLKTHADLGENGDGEYVFNIWNLFILRERRRGGIGKTAFQELESLARVAPYGSPECKALTLNAISRLYIEDDGEEWRGMYSKLCASRNLELPPKGRSTEDWYAMMGYVKWREEPAYPVEVDGKHYKLVSVYMRKPFQSY